MFQGPKRRPIDLKIYEDHFLEGRKHRSEGGEKVEARRPQRRGRSTAAWYVSNVSIIFYWSMLVLLCCHMFLLSYYIIFMHFVGLTCWQDAKCQFPIFVGFLFQKIYFWKYSRNWTKIYAEFLLDGRHQDTKGHPWGPPTDQGRPADCVYW